MTNEGRLVITARTLEFYESRGDVASAVVQGDMLTVKASMSGEGETWDQNYSFHLSPDGQALRQRISLRDEGIRRFRCPGPVQR